MLEDDSPTPQVHCGAGGVGGGHTVNGLTYSPFVGFYEKFSREN